MKAILRISLLKLNRNDKQMKQWKLTEYIKKSLILYIFLLWMNLEEKKEKSLFHSICACRNGCIYPEILGTQQITSSQIKFNSFSSLLMQNIYLLIYLFFCYNIQPPSPQFFSLLICFFFILDFISFLLSLFLHFFHIVYSKSGTIKMRNKINRGKK